MAVKSYGPMSVLSGGRTLRHLWILGALLLLVLAGCSPTVASALPAVEPISSTEVVRTIYFTDRGDIGPGYTVSMTVPEEWVGQFQTRTVGNTIYFDYLGEPPVKGTLFTISALSTFQYWKQVGGYPGTHVDIVNTGDTYFVYSLPTNSRYSGLSQGTYDALSAQVPDVVGSFAAQLN